MSCDGRDDLCRTRSSCPPDVVDPIAQRAAGSDVSGHLDPDVAAALRTTASIGCCFPVELGGAGGVARRCVDVVERIAAADSSTAWAAAIGFGTNLFAGYVDRDGAAELFGDPTSRTRRCSPRWPRCRRRLTARCG